MKPRGLTSVNAIHAKTPLGRFRTILFFVALAFTPANFGCGGGGSSGSSGSGGGGGGSSGGGGGGGGGGSGGALPTGDVYVTSGLGITTTGITSGAVHFDARTGNLVGNPFAVGLSPRGLAFGPDGNLYVAAQGLLATGIVIRFDRSGNFIDCFVPRVNDLQTCLLSPPNLGNVLAGFFYDLKFERGNLWVAADNAVLIFDGTSGAFTRFVPVSALFIAFGPDNNLYLVTSSPSPSIQRFDMTTGQLSTIITNFTGVPIGSGISFGPLDGKLYVINNQTNPAPGGGTVTLAQVDRYDLNGNRLNVFVQATSGGLGDASNLVFGNDRNLYVLDASGNNHILCYDGTTGGFLRPFSTVPSSIGSLPGYMAFNPP